VNACGALSMATTPHRPAENAGRTATTSREKATLTLHAIGEIGKTLRTLIRVAGGSFAALVLYWTVVALAGRTTSLLVRVAINALFDVRFALMLGGAAAAVVWAVLERRLRQRTILRLHPRVKQLETMIDPGRSSSNLTPKGETNPMDIEP
jgi:hypothetical protein